MQLIILVKGGLLRVSFCWIVSTQGLAIFLAHHFQSNPHSDEREVQAYKKVSKTFAFDRPSPGLLQHFFPLFLGLPLFQGHIGARIVAGLNAGRGIQSKTRHQVT